MQTTMNGIRVEHPHGIAAVSRTRTELPGTLACPRCQRTAHRGEETEWLTFYRCTDCGWRFAKGRPGGR